MTLPRKLVGFDEETWHALNLLSRESMKSFQELADEAFRDLLQKYGRPTDFKAALRESAAAQGAFCTVVVVISHHQTSTGSGADQWGLLPVPISAPLFRLAPTPTLLRHRQLPPSFGSRSSKNWKAGSRQRSGYVCRTSVARTSLPSDVVMSLAVSLADDHFENERVGLGGAHLVISISLAVNFLASHKAN